MEAGKESDRTDADAPRRRGRRIALAVGLVVGLVAILGVLLVCLLDRSSLDGLFRRRFDAATWAATDVKEYERAPFRWRMVDDLVAHHLHAGMTTAETEALLGPRDPDPLLAPPREGDWLYMVGPTPSELVGVSWHMLTSGGGSDADEVSAFGSSVTFRALVLGFDSGGRLERYEVIER